MRKRHWYALTSLLIAPLVYTIIRCAFGYSPFPDVPPSHDLVQAVHLLTSIVVWMVAPMPGGWALSYIDSTWVRRLSVAVAYILITSYGLIWLVLFPGDQSVAYCPMLSLFGFWMALFSSLAERKPQALDRGLGLLGTFLG